LIHSGDLLRQVHAKLAAASRRNAIADRVLGACRYLAGPDFIAVCRSRHAAR